MAPKPQRHDASPLHFDFIATAMGIAAGATQLSPDEVTRRVAELARQIRAGTESLPRERVLSRNQVHLLRVALVAATDASRVLAEECPSLKGTREHEELEDAIDGLDNKIENHELALTIGPALEETREAARAFAARG